MRVFSPTTPMNSSPGSRFGVLKQILHGYIGKYGTIHPLGTDNETIMGYITGSMIDSLSVPQGKYCAICSLLTMYYLYAITYEWI